MAFLASALAMRGHDVVYIAELELDSERVALGWQLPELTGARLCLIGSDQDIYRLIEEAPIDTFHLTQGLRANGRIAIAQILIKKFQFRHFVLIETVDPRGLLGLIRSAVYWWHLKRWQNTLTGILAIGADTPDWLRLCGSSKINIYPFAYFLQEACFNLPSTERKCFRFIYVGSFIARKRVGFLLKALARLTEFDFELDLVGGGPLGNELKVEAERLLPGRVTFHGVVPISEIPKFISRADCLILPSSHDGWGAVVSEALMVGTPAICSRACGSRAVVEASGVGGIFETENIRGLESLLLAALDNGSIQNSDREALKAWAKCLGAEVGAKYLEELLVAQLLKCPVHTAPWMNGGC